MKLFKNQNFWFFLILALAAILRLWNLAGNDITNDAAINAFRSFGWFDFLTSDGQTTPIVWFGFRPWWSLLSFHDLPPLAMLIQYFFIKILGADTIGVLLPFVLSSLLVIFFLYDYLKKLVNPLIGLLAAMIFAVSSYSVWTARTGYLEGVEVLFIILSFFFFLFFIKEKQLKYFYFFVIFTALSLLTKYTSLFLIPAALVYLVVFQRSIFKNKHFYLALLTGLVLLSPIIIYNIFVFKTRGHFDAAFSSMLGMHPEDFSAIAERGVNTNFLQNLGSIMVVIFRSSTWGLSLIYVFSALAFTIKIVRRQAHSWQYFLALNIFFLMLMFSFSGAPPRLLSIINPFLDIMAGWFLYKLWLYLKNKKMWRYIVSIILSLLLVFEIFYAINTNILSRTLGSLHVAYSGYRFYNQGFVELEHYLLHSVYGNLQREKFQTYDDLKKFTLKEDFVVLFDERMDWFARVWYINRYMIYYRAPFFYFEDISPAMQLAGYTNVFSYFQSLGINQFWFVYTTEAGRQVKKSDNYDQQMELIKNDIIKSGIEPTKTISNYREETVFEIYHFYLQ